MKYYIVFVFFVLINFKSTSQDIVKTGLKTDTVAIQKAQQFLEQLQIEYGNGKYETLA